jgi:hypothetical protein
MNMLSQHSLDSDPPRSTGGIKRNGQALLACVWPIRSGYDVVRILAAVVLLTVAGLKAHQLATEPVLAKTWLDSRWLLMASVEFELFFGLWLFSNNLPRLTWLATICCFALFACVSLCSGKGMKRGYLMRVRNMRRNGRNMWRCLVS